MMSNYRFFLKSLLVQEQQIMFLKDIYGVDFIGVIDL